MKWYLRVLKKYATFEGRARRKEFWYFKLFHNLIIYACLLYGLYAVFSDPELNKNADFSNLLPKILSPLLILYLIATFLPNLAVSVRRLHDINRSADHMLMWLVAPVGPLVLFIFHAMPGNHGDNKFGPDPITTPDPPPMSAAARRRRERIASNRRVPYHSQRPRTHTPNYRTPPPRQAYEEYQRYADYDNQGDEAFDDGDSQPYLPAYLQQTPHQHRRKRKALLYGLDQPISDEGEQYYDPFVTNLSSQDSLIDEQLKRFGVIADEPPQEESPRPALESDEEKYEGDHENISLNPHSSRQTR